MLIRHRNIFRVGRFERHHPLSFQDAVESNNRAFIKKTTSPVRGFDSRDFALLYLNKNVSRCVVEIPVILEKLSVFGR